MEVFVDICSDAESWSSCKEINKLKIANVTKEILLLHEALRDFEKFSLSILLTDAKRMKSLNAQFRKKDYVADVLSFPNLNISEIGLKDEFTGEDDCIYLGDIAFGYEPIMKYADENIISFADRFMHLLVHSVLHLLNYTHDTDHDFEIMSKLEHDILKIYSITPTYFAK